MLKETATNRLQAKCEEHLIEELHQTTHPPNALRPIGRRDEWDRDDWVLDEGKKQERPQGVSTIDTTRKLTSHVEQPDWDIEDPEQQGQVWVMQETNKRQVAAPSKSLINLRWFAWHLPVEQLSGEWEWRLNRLWEDHNQHQAVRRGC